MNTITFQKELEPYLSRLGTTPEDKPSFIKEVYEVQDIKVLQQWVIRKEREKQTISNNLEVAARMGLVVSETNEALQLKLEHLERENKAFQEQKSDDYNNNEEEEEKLFLQRELDQARRALYKFRKEMDGLSAQLNDMASEMAASRTKVGVYAKRLAEVEHKLATTRDVNTNLQSLLDKALVSQEQSSSNTSHLFKTIQTDLERVVYENERLRVRIAELEGQQVENEGKIAVMVVQAKEYSTRLDQAQNIIHNLSEPKLSEDDFHAEYQIPQNQQLPPLQGVEITKGPVFSAEFRQEMQKEIERNLNLRNEIRHRIITADSNQDKKRAAEGLKYLVSDRENGGLASLSTSASSSNSSILSNVMKKDMIHQTIQEDSKAPTLRPASFLTGFSGFGTEGLGIGGNFIARSIPPHSESSDEEWVVTSSKKPNTSKKSRLKQSGFIKHTPQTTTRISRPVKRKEHNLINYDSNSSSASSFVLPTSIGLPPSAMYPTPPQEISLQHLPKQHLRDICKTMDAKKLVSQLISTYKSVEVFLKIKKIETEQTSFETTLCNQLEACQDPCSFIIDCLEALSLYFSVNGKNRELTPNFRCMLAEALCKGLSLYLNIPPDKQKVEEIDLITFEDDLPKEVDLISFEDDTPKEVDLINFEDSGFLIQLDTETEDSSEDDSDEDSIPIISFTEEPSKYTVNQSHQDKIIGLVDTIPSPVIIYYALDVFQLKDLIGLHCEREEEGVRLTRRMLKYGYYSETINAIKKLNLYEYFPIPSIANDMLNASQGNLLASFVSDRSDLQMELLQFVEKQLRFNFAGSLGVVPHDKLKEMDTDTTKQLIRLSERKFQKGLVTCGVKIAQDRNLQLSKSCYFTHLSQRYACLRWMLTQRALQQMEDNDLSIEKSSNYNGLIDLVCENEPALARLTIKELIDMGDTVAPAYFATQYKEEKFFCRYNSLAMSERYLGVVKGEQMSRHWSSLGPKKQSNPSKLPYYQLPSEATWLVVNSEKSLIFMKDILSQSHLCGIDTEWVPAFATTGTPAKTALMQIASGVGGYIFLLDLKTISSSENKSMYKIVEKILQFFFEDEEILKIAYDFTGDFQLLYQSIPSSKNWDVIKLLDLKTLTSPVTAHAENGLPMTGGLAGVVGTYLGRALDKRQQISNWEKRPLTEEQAIYAACDAYCLLEIYEILTKSNHPFLKEPTYTTVSNEY